MSAKDEVIKFPCYFPIKAIGKDEADYRAFVIESVRVQIAELNQDEVTTRLSHGGKYLAVTVPLVAQSREQLDAIYLTISQDPRTVFML
jgi:putative lipoic acid-binding regulatory protein